MAAPASAEELLHLVRKSRLLDEGRLREFLDQTGLHLHNDPRRLAAAFIAGGLMTRFQAEQLLKGKYKGFELGKYQLLDRIGSGGMGQVFLAHHPLMGRRVAVKVLSPQLCGDPVARERFLREAKAAGALAHPNIVRAYDVGEDRGMLFLVLEHVDGRSLQEIVSATGPLAVERAAYYLWQAAVGLQHAHAAGLVHRDVKPANLLLDRTGVVKLLDLGLARFFNEPSDGLTNQGTDKSVLGTADYLAPEQAINSSDVDIRADIYSLGATGYFLLTGKPPFGGGSTTQKLLAHQMKEPDSVLNARPDVPPELLGVIGRMMRKDPARRFQTPAEVMAALEPWSRTPPPPPDAEMPALDRAGPLSGSGHSSAVGMHSSAVAGIRSVIGQPTMKMQPTRPRKWFAPIAAVVVVLVGFTAGAILASRLTANRSPAVAAAPPPAEAPPAAAAVPPIPARAAANGDRVVGPGHYATLTDALEAAGPGERVVVRVNELTEPLRLQNWNRRVTVVGEPPSGSRVAWKPAAAHPPGEPLVRLTGVDGLVFREFVFDGDGRLDVLAEVADHAIDSAFEQCRFQNYRATGLRLVRAFGKQDHWFRVAASRFVGSPGAAAAVSLEAVGLEKLCHSVQFKNCRFEGPSAAGARFAGGATGVIFTNCRFHNLGTAIRTEPTASPPRLRLHVMNNTFGRCDAAVRLARPPVDTDESLVRIASNLFAGCGQMVVIDAEPIAGDSPPKFFGRPAGNVRSADCAPSPYLPDVPAERFTLPTAADDDATFLRYDAASPLARKHGSPGLPPAKPASP